nr:MAG TPA: hypothetical protein [Caudoviricetes sp.]
MPSIYAAYLHAHLDGNLLPLLAADVPQVQDLVILYVHGLVHDAQNLLADPLALHHLRVGCLHSVRNAFHRAGQRLTVTSAAGDRGQHLCDVLCVCTVPLYLFQLDLFQFCGLAVPPQPFLFFFIGHWTVLPLSAVKMFLVDLQRRSNKKKRNATGKRNGKRPRHHNASHVYCSLHCLFLLSQIRLFRQRHPDRKVIREGCHHVPRPICCVHVAGVYVDAQNAAVLVCILCGGFSLCRFDPSQQARREYFRGLQQCFKQPVIHIAAAMFSQTFSVFYSPVCEF